jgi:geranylgeranyl pyrophosphate synthase
MSEVLKISVDLSGKLDLINKRLVEVLKTDNPRLNEMSNYTISSGGKRQSPWKMPSIWQLHMR